MGRMTLSGCARNNLITRDEVQCDPVVSGAAIWIKDQNNL